MPRVPPTLAPPQPAERPRAHPLALRLLVGYAAEHQLAPEPRPFGLKFRFGAAVRPPGHSRLPPVRFEPGCRVALLLALPLHVGGLGGVGFPLLPPGYIGADGRQRGVQGCQGPRQDRRR
jgi:hypothetical protein